MKELSIEEKAKRYDEALARANEMIKDMTNMGGVAKVDDIQYIFPELKESEDERIRKGLIEYFLHYPDHEITYYGLKADFVISWLEKQGEQKPAVIIPKFRIGDEIKTSNEESLTITKIDEKGYWSEDLFICSFDDADKWKLVEQNPAWSEDDQSNFNELSSFIFETYRTEDASRLITWLEYLKDRVQPKQEWSEEDRLHYMNVLEALEYVKGCKSDYDKIESVKSDIAWFKFLKDRYTWKLSESDIRILEQVIGGTINPINYHATLYAILEQLKKLR